MLPLGRGDIKVSTKSEFHLKSWSVKTSDMIWEKGLIFFFSSTRLLMNKYQKLWMAQIWDKQSMLESLNRSGSNCRNWVIGLGWRLRTGTEKVVERVGEGWIEQREYFIGRGHGSHGDEKLKLTNSFVYQLINKWRRLAETQKYKSCGNRSTCSV